MLKRRLDADLLIVDALTLLLLLTVFVLPVSWLRQILGLIFLLFCPGYMLVEAAFPRQESLRVAPRLALSFGMSITAAVFIGLLLSYTPWGIKLASLLISLSLFTLLLSCLACYTRGRISTEERFKVNPRIAFPSLWDCLKTASPGYRSLVIVLSCAILGSIGALGYVMTRPVPAQPFSEFYILGLEVRAGNYPLELRRGEEGKVIVGIVSHEAGVTEYNLQVIADGNSLYELAPVRLKPGEKWEGTVGFTLRETGNRQKVEFLLDKDKNESPEVRYLWVDVRE